MLEKFGNRCDRIARGYFPDPFTLALLLTILTLGLAAWFCPVRPSRLLQDWNHGFWELLRFSMQLALMVVTGEAIARSGPVQKLLNHLCSIPKTSYGAVIGLTFFSICLGWIHWALGLIAAALGGRQLARTMQDKKIALHYPLIGAAAYMSTLLWHAGLSGIAPLLMNTPENFLQSQSGLIPLSQTVFLPVNLFACLSLAIVIPLVLASLMPRRNIKSIDQFHVEKPNPIKARMLEQKPRTFAEKLERSYLINAIVGLMGALFLFHHFLKNGSLDLNTLNFLFLIVGILLARNPKEYAGRAGAAVKNAAEIVLIFPFYGGILGIVRYSGLGNQIATAFIQYANLHTLPVLTYMASVVIKFLIPSAGGQWATEAPVVLKAAHALKASPGVATLAVAYGNMVGNMIQPFWAIPLLSIMGLKSRDVMGPCLAAFCFAFPILAIALFAA